MGPLGIIVAATVILSNNPSYKEKGSDIDNAMLQEKMPRLFFARKVASLIYIAVSFAIAALIYSPADSISLKRVGIILLCIIALFFLVITRLFSYLIRRRQKFLV